MTQETSPKPKKSGPLANMSRQTLYVLLGGIIAIVLVLMVVVALNATQSPAFFSRYTSWGNSVSTLAGSAHKGIACSACHAGATGFTYRAQLVGEFYASLFVKPDVPLFLKLPAPTRDQCLKCHTYDWAADPNRIAKVPHPAHLRTIIEKRDCVTCHRWVGHEEAIQAGHQKMPFSVVCASFACHVGWKQPNDCKNCHHQLQQSLDTWKVDHPQVVRTIGPNACLERCHKADQCRTCHTTGKTPVFPGVINASTVSDIEHAHIKSDWLTKHGGFALQDQKKCLTCHVNLQECQDCHSHRPPFHGTDNTAWIGTGHAPIAKVNPRRCFECHKPTQCNACHTQFGPKLPQFSQDATPGV